MKNNPLIWSHCNVVVVVVVVVYNIIVVDINTWSLLAWFRRRTFVVNDPVSLPATL